jgi:aminomethyltransferase
LEAGLPLHGHELKPERVGLGHPWNFAISWEHDFIGKAALIANRDSGIRYYVRPFVMEGKRKAMTGWNVVSGNKTVGTVLSGVISPTLNNTPIGFMEVDTLFDEDTRLSFIQNNGSVQLEGKVGALPFVPLTSHRKMSDFLP